MKKFLLSTFYFLLSRNEGQSLLEILIALVVGSIFVIGATSVIIPSLRSNTQAGRIQVSSALGKELLENAKVFSEADWHNIYNLNKGSANHYYLTTSTSPFSAVVGDESLIVSTTTYTRYFYVENVGRDASGNILSSGGTDDPSTQKITVVYSWAGGPANSFIIYLTRYVNKVLDQTDWSGGPGQNSSVTSTNNMFATSSQIDYSTTTGSIYIKLQ